MSEFLPFHMPDIGEEEVSEVVQVLRSGWLTTGTKAKQFENEFAAMVGARHAIAVNSCTAALHLALEAIGVREGDEVIVPTMTFAATAEVVAYLKAKPILVDCTPDTLNISPDCIERAITPRTKAIVPVHFAGHPCEMSRIQAIARAHNLAVIEDAAHALPARYRGKMIGSLSELTCFSFYATKNITTGEGGMVTTDDSALAARVRIMSLHGLSRDAWSRYTAQGSWYYEILSPGFKYNLTDIAAALGLAQLAKCDRFWKSRDRLAALYRDGFHDVPEILCPSAAAHVQHAWHLYVIRLNLEALRIDRNEFIAQLQQAGIGCSVHFIPLHLHPYYRETYGYQPSDFPTAQAAFERIVSLPLYPKMTEADIQRVITVVRDIVKGNRR
ncbi:MAG: DegT/DnrJ/EryC1/StrS family aminotransferase [Nitrospira sp.]|jgi:perosamine synthetase|nr:DegT/DnrJ/EryC1/StrS family aminotransferase [Nitrospira sp.]MBP6605258.1 DegT/DnrJ/EryC1/StrS family aminotransferase [Nitrospira sp.]HQY58787.1 DegT/DnrJ/EryC1/StrS family aminotransferase [Nitrospira sp.]HRA95330.1 DegT/DnrJ/EryC1/StrS family aminotransferase [Nitrospira sp.]